MASTQIRRLLHCRRCDLAWLVISLRADYIPHPKKIFHSPKDYAFAMRPYLETRLNETELIQALRQKQEPAFRWLVDNYHARVYATVLNIVQDADDADDVTQEVFIKVYESVGGFKQDSSLSTWIYRIAVHKALDKIRRKKARGRLQRWLPGWMPQEQKSEQQPFYHPGIELDKKEKAAVLFKALATIPEKQQLAFTLIKIQGMSYDEASSILQVSIKAAESLISRAKENLQQQLQDYYQTDLK